MLARLTGNMKVASCNLFLTEFCCIRWPVNAERLHCLWDNQVSNKNLWSPNRSIINYYCRPMYGTRERSKNSCEADECDFNSRIPCEGHRLRCHKSTEVCEKFLVSQSVNTITICGFLFANVCKGILFEMKHFSQRLRDHLWLSKIVFSYSLGVSYNRDAHLSCHDVGERIEKFSC